MWQWLNSNSAVLNVLISFGTLLVWLCYLQLFLYGFRRRRRCKILINMGGHSSLKARCLICNMSEEPVYVMSLLAVVTTPSATWRHPVTEYEFDNDAPLPEGPGQVSRQGPLRVGDCRDVGSFADLVERARHAHGDWQPEESLSRDSRPTEIKLVVLAIYGSEDLPVAADRCFRLVDDDGVQRIDPRTVETRQIRGRRARRQLYRRLRDYA